MTQPNPVAQTVEVVATSPLSSLPTSPLLPPSDPDDASDDFLYDYTYSDTFGPAAERFTPQQKLEKVIQTLREVHWTFSQFLLAWVGIGDDLQDRDILLENREARTPAQRYRRLHRVVQKIRDLRVDAFETRPIIETTISQELNSLVGKTFFGRFDHTVQTDALDYTIVSDVIKQWAPTWYTLMTQLLRNKRAGWGSYSARPQDITISRRLYTITSLVCNSRAKQQSSHYGSMLSTYLLSSGTKRRAIEVLSGLGICLGYHQTRRILDEVATEGAV